MDDGEVVMAAASDPNLCPEHHISFTPDAQGIPECAVCHRHPVAEHNPVDYGVFRDVVRQRDDMWNELNTLKQNMGSDYAEVVQQNAALMTRIAHVSGELATAVGRVGALEDENAHLHSDITKIVKTIEDEVEERGWCDEYDDTIGQLQSTLSRAWFTPRVITWQQRFEMVVSFTTKRNQLDEACTEILDNAKALGEGADYSEGHVVNVRVTESRKVD